MPRPRRRLARLVSALDLPPAADPAALCVAVAASLGRTIQLVPAALPPDAPCGLAITTSSTHFVVYDNTTSPLHQQHIIRHELGHLIAGHHQSQAFDAETAQVLLPTLDPGTIQRVLGRASSYDSAAEWEAETIADLLWRRTRPTDAERVRQLAPEAAEIVARMRLSFTGD